jgi:hypothetical protein
MTYIIVLILVVVVFFILYKIFKFIISVILILVFMLLAFLTNPSLEMHERAVQRKATQTDTALKGKRVQRDNFYLFSLTEIIEGKDRSLVGAGAFTQVFIFKKP